MALVRRVGSCARILVWLVLLVGCSLARPGRPGTVPDETRRAVAQAHVPTAAPRPRAERPTNVMPVAHHLPDAPRPVPQEVDGLFSGQAELSLPVLTREVASRNPSLQAMAYAWRAAAQRYPQVVRLDDPTFMAMMAPASFDSNQVNPGYTLQVAQKLPWFGKLQTRGQGAQAEAGALFQDVQDARLVIYVVTRLAFYDYYLAERQLQINGQNRQAAQEFRDSAQVKYENNQVTQLDVIQADVELADLRRRQIELERMRRVGVARINTLLLRAADGPLPPSPPSLPPEAELPAADSLLEMTSTLS